MKTYTYSEARQKLAALLDRARREGRVHIRRRDGQLFVLQPTKVERSPLDVPGVQARLRRGEITEWIKRGREASAARLLDRALSNNGIHLLVRASRRLQKRQAARRASRR